MKNLVKKIALPGAILAFAMALFGVSAYAEEIVPIFKEWEQHIQGSQKKEEIKSKINVLLDRIKTLKEQKSTLEGVLQNSSLQTSDANQVKQKIEDKDRDIKRLEQEINQLKSSRTNDSSQATNRHNAEMNSAENAMNDIWSHIDSKMKEDTYTIPNHE